jgi:hypothetical protein
MFGQKQLDLSKPEDALLAARKIQASLKDGEICTFYWSGIAYSRIAQERDKPLFRFVGMNIRATKTDTAKGKIGFKQVSREILLFLDLKKDTILKKWENPLTKKNVNVFQITNDPVNSRGILTTEQIGLPFETIDGRVFWGIEIPLLYPNPLQGEEYAPYVGTLQKNYQAIEIFNFSANEKELLDKKKKTCQDVTISWARMSQWLPWMEMGDREGWVIFTGQGKKISKWEQMHPLLRQYIDEEQPAYKMPPPLDDKRPNKTSWLDFKEKIKLKK